LTDSEADATEAESDVELEAAAMEDGKEVDIDVVGVDARVGVVGAADGVDDSEVALGVEIEGLRREERECLDEVEEPEELRECA
jgi:hypothetical protein